MSLYTHESTYCNACQSRLKSRSGHAVCNYDGVLWEVDRDYLSIIEHAFPDSERGELPWFVLAQLRDKGSYLSGELRIRAFREGAGLLKVCVSL